MNWKYGMMEPQYYDVSLGSLATIMSGCYHCAAITLPICIGSTLENRLKEQCQPGSACLLF
jgi:hypothetical protein